MVVTWNCFSVVNSFACRYVTWHLPLTRELAWMASALALDPAKMLFIFPFASTLRLANQVPVKGMTAKYL